MVLAVPLVCIVLYQAPTVPLTGIVVGPNGEPVAGAEVLLGGLPAHGQTIVARGRSNAQGRFTIVRPSGLAGENRYSAPILWVVKPGFRLGSLKFPGPLPKAGEPVRIVLGPPGKGEVRVEDPNGQPVAGARIRLEWFGHEQINVPEAVEDLIEVTADKDGRSVIEAAANDEIAYVDVHAKGFGIQGRTFRPLNSQPKRVRLRQVALLEGRLQADDPTMARGWQVLAYTYAGEGWSGNQQTIGFARATTDAAGRFAFPVIAPGRLQLEVKPPGNLPVMAEVPDSLAVTAGRPNSVVVPLRKTVPITGEVREHATGRPVPGAVMHLSPARGGTVLTARTDVQGRYTFTSLPGKWHVSPFKLPPALIRAPGPPWKEITVSEGQGRLELEPWEAIPAAPPLRFIVRDENGRPAAHARITGQSGSQYMPETTDSGGEFAISGLPPGSEVSIEVRLGERMTDGPVKAISGTTQPIAVTILPGLATAFAGRVIGPGGAPIADAEVRLQFRDKSAHGVAFAIPQTLSFGDGDEIRTAADGTFRTPKDVYRKNREFRFEVTAEGFFNGKTGWESADGGERITFPDLVLRPRPTQRLIAGRVADGGGKGVDAVTVFQRADSLGRTEAITDAGGRFRLDGVPEPLRPGVRREVRLPVRRSGREARRCAGGDPLGAGRGAPDLDPEAGPAAAGPGRGTGHRTGADRALDRSRPVGFTRPVGSSRRSRPGADRSRSRPGDAGKPGAAAGDGCALPGRARAARGRPGCGGCHDRGRPNPGHPRPGLPRTRRRIDRRPGQAQARPDRPRAGRDSARRGQGAEAEPPSAGR